MHLPFLTLMEQFTVISEGGRSRFILLWWGRGTQLLGVWGTQSRLCTGSQGGKRVKQPIAGCLGERKGGLRVWKSAGGSSVSRAYAWEKHSGALGLSRAQFPHLSKIRTTLAMGIQWRVKKKRKLNFCALKCVKVLRTLLYFLMYSCAWHSRVRGYGTCLHVGVCMCVCRAKVGELFSFTILANSLRQSLYIGTLWYG